MDEQQQYTKENILKAFASLDAHILLKLYQKENILFGRIKPNEIPPLERYIEELGLQGIANLLDLQIFENLNFEPDQVNDYNKICFEVFRDRIDFLFTDVPIDKSFDDDDEDIYHYKYGLYDYVKNLYPLFKEIIETEVTPDLFTAVPDVLDKDVSRDYYIKAIKFVLAIKLKGLRQGGRVDRYIAKMPFISPLLMRLLNKRKGHFYLKNNDMNSLDYKFALLSCFQFMNDYNTKLFELKMLRWEEK